MPCPIKVSSSRTFQWTLLTLVSSTPLLQDWLGDDAPKRHRREIHFPSGRFGEAIEQAQAVLFLASDESSFVNGTDFLVDGGMSRVSNPAAGRQGPNYLREYCLTSELEADFLGGNK